MASDSKKSIVRSDAFSFSYLPCEVAEAVAFCRDLVLCRTFIESKCVCYICNPLFRSWIQLPDCLPPHDKSSSSYGFICQGSGTTFRYVVILIPIPKGDYIRGRNDVFKVQICSSDSGGWSEKTFSCGREIDKLLYAYGIQWKGMLFWNSYLSELMIGIDPFNEGDCCMVIDLLPEQPKDDHECPLIGVSKGNLRWMAVETDFHIGGDVLTIHVWDLQDSGNFEWQMEYKISFTGLLQSKGATWFKDANSVSPLAFDPNNAEIIYIFVGLSTIVSCNSHKQSLEVVFE